MTRLHYPRAVRLPIVLASPARTSGVRACDILNWPLPEPARPATRTFPPSAKERARPSAERSVLITHLQSLFPRLPARQPPARISSSLLDTGNLPAYTRRSHCGNFLRANEVLLTLRLCFSLASSPGSLLIGRNVFLLIIRRKF